MSNGPARKNSTGLVRDLDILEILSKSDAAGVGVSRIASILDRDKTQISRALSTLAEAGIVERDADTRAYRLGWKIHFLATQTEESRLATLATPILRQLTFRTGAASHLFILRGKFTSAISSQANDHLTTAWSWVDRQSPAPVTSPGRVLMSDWDTDSVTAAFPTAVLETYGGNLKTRTTETLLQELASIRAQGYALIRQEYDSGVGCSAPVRTPNGRIVAAINLEGPPPLFEKRLDSMVELTCKAAAVLSARIGKPASDRQEKPGSTPA